MAVGRLGDGREARSARAERECERDAARSRRVGAARSSSLAGLMFAKAPLRACLPNGCPAANGRPAAQTALCAFVLRPSHRYLGHTYH
jgi:hypothetical protein